MLQKSSISQPIARLLAQEKVRFIVIGGTGFITNYLGLALFFDLLKLNIILAQVISAELAILVTFTGNNTWAFRGHDTIPLTRKLWRYHVSSVVGMTLTSLVTVALVDMANLYYGLALVVGAFVGLLWNYTAYKRFVFKTHKVE